MFNKNVCFLLAALAISSVPVSAQKKKNFTIAEATNGLSGTLAIQSVRQPGWQPGSHNFYQVVKDGSNEYWVRTTIPSGKTDTVESVRGFNKRQPGKDSLRGFPVLGWIDHDYAFFNQGHRIVRGTLTGNGISWESWVNLPEHAENVVVDKSQQVAYTVKNNLWIAGRDGKSRQVTSDADENIVNGQSVHRNEFGITGGTFFSPRGNYLAYYHMDQRMVKDYPVVNWGEMPATVQMVKYPMAGGPSHEVTLRVFDPKTGQTVEMETGAPADQYLTSVTWSPDEQYIFIALLNREQNHLKLNQYSAATGRFIKTLFEEKHSKYVEPEHQLSFLPGSNERFIWWSERDGYEHLYLYNTSGQMIRQLTSGKYEVNEIVGFNPASKDIIITSAKESPLEKHSYAVNWTNGRMRRLDREAGVHTVMASDDGTYIYDTYNAAAVPRVSLIRGVNSNYTKMLLESKNTLNDYLRPEVQSVTMQADDGTTLYGKLILPTDFNPAKKYPVVVYLYNGPHVQLVRNSFPESGNLWYDYMAQRGYVVFSMDGRGSSNRGRDFEQATFRNMGTVEMNDQLKGVAYLRSLPFVDTARMGVHGWSYGGFMTTSLMLRHPGVFKVGVAGGPVMDWSMYEVMYTERYMDTPEQNPKGYAQSVLFDKIKNLNGKLLLIHGTDDATVVWQHSINFLKKAVSDGVQVDYFVYPGYEHNVRGKDRAHLMEKISEYFDTWLKPLP